MLKFLTKLDLNKVLFHSEDVLYSTTAVLLRHIPGAGTRDWRHVEKELVADRVWQNNSSLSVCAGATASGPCKHGAVHDGRCGAAGHCSKRGSGRARACRAPLAPTSWHVSAEILWSKRGVARWTTPLHGPPNDNRACSNGGRTASFKEASTKFHKY